MEKVKDQRKVYIIMENCENGDMTQLIKKVRQEKDWLVEDVIWKIFIQLLMALNSCHERPQGKIIHLDIKPGNVFFDSSNNVKLGDFGLSRMLGKDSILWKSHCGTPYYMSPELIKEQNYNEKADIWSAGCILYELISLRPPFEATNHLALA